MKKAQEEAHLLEGLNIAITHLDEVVELIKASKNPQEAKEQLIERFKLSEIQAQKILEMRLQRLTGLESVIRYPMIIRISCRDRQASRRSLGDETLVMQIIKDEFIEIKNEYGDQRRTEIIDAVDEILPEDLIIPEEMAVTVTHSGYIKRNPVSLYRSQNRGGKGVQGVANVEEDFVSNLYVASTLDTFLFFTNFGKVFWRKVYELPLVGRTARGKAIVNLLELSEGEKIAAILPLSKMTDDNLTKTLMMVTKLGRIKKTDLNEFIKPLRKGKRALTVNEGDEIISAHILSGNDTVFLISRKGMSIHFHESDIRNMGRMAAGVIGVRLTAGDEIVGAIVISDDSSILIVTENGYGKRSPVSEYRIQKRGGKGIFAIKQSERNGRVVGAMQVTDNDEVILIANSGKMIRMPLKNVRTIGRTTQGVRLINLQDDEKVVGMDSVAFEESDDDIPDEE